MAEKYFYLELGKEPKDSDFVALFKIEPVEGKSVEEAANSVAAESSIGTWTEVATMSESFRETFKARVTRIEGNYVEIAYPSILFEKGNMSQIYSSVAGNIFGMKDVKNLRLESLKTPKDFVESFDGPKYGIDGIREKLKIKKRPIVGTIVKPKIGLDPESQSQVMYEAMVGGVDVVKDDENLTSQEFCPFEERLKKCLEKRKKAEDETGEGKGYIPNITAPLDIMLKRAELVEKMGGIFAMVDIITVGWSALQSLRKESFNLVLHGHRAMHGAFTRNKLHGISMEVIARSARLVGIDQLHIGTAVGKMEGKRDEVEKCADALRLKEEGEGRLRQNWFSVKRAMPIASGGLHPGHIPALYEIFGDDCIFQFGGGIHGHPEGTKSGAKAVRDSLNASLRHISLSSAAEDSRELKMALEKWGSV
ncbi:MAG: type III ribulose-bisphosphate carboxylase [Thermoanaerobaculaceae bacterium]|nr:type III ribulose-bisphosphate carboxylase [Thermoanaerobaculaceae bacterium]